MIKRFFVLLTIAILIGVFVLSLSAVLAQEKPKEQEIVINFFYSTSCPHCIKENLYLDELEIKYPHIKVNRYVSSDKENIKLLQQYYELYSVPEQIHGLVPITFMNDKYHLGFDDSIKAEIEDCILKFTKDENIICDNKQHLITLPLFGDIDMDSYPLPLLTIILGTLDGFNVCSLGALVLILALVLALKSRKKILFFGSLFIFTTALVYGLLIVLWYQIFHIFSPYQQYLEALIVLIGIVGGIYFLKQFIKYRKYGPTCEIDTGQKIMTKFSGLFQRSVQQSKNIFLIMGLVLVFAGIITIVEFPCSAAVPVAFAGMLATSNLTSWSYLFYIALFLVFYMLDEIIVFLIAFFTMKIWLANSKAVVYITLIEALVLFGFSLYYLLGLIR